MCENWKLSLSSNRLQGYFVREDNAAIAPPSGDERRPERVQHHEGKQGQLIRTGAVHHHQMPVHASNADLEYKFLFLIFQMQAYETC